MRSSSLPNSCWKGSSDETPVPTYEEEKKERYDGWDMDKRDLLGRVAGSSLEEDDKVIYLQSLLEDVFETIRKLKKK